jgi:hypothetical protein
MPGVRTRTASRAHLLPNDRWSLGTPHPCRRPVAKKQIIRDGSGPFSGLAERGGGSWTLDDPPPFARAVFAEGTDSKGTV